MSITELSPIEDDTRFTHDNSLYSNSDVFSENDNKFFSVPKITINKSSNDIFYKVGNGEVGRLDIISNKFYDTTQLWWVIALSNKIFNTFTEVTVGKILRIPDIIAVRRELNL